jgi:hypothetical protein
MNMQISHAKQCEAIQIAHNKQFEVINLQLDIMEAFLAEDETYVEYLDPLNLSLIVKKIRKFIGKFRMNPWMSQSFILRK